MRRVSEEREEGVSMKRRKGEKQEYMVRSRTRTVDVRRW